MGVPDADAGEQDFLATQGQTRRVRPELVNHAKRAKMVDVRKLKENIWRGLNSKWGAHNPKLHIQGSKLGVHREIRINAYSASMGESFVEGTLLRETCLEVHSFPDDPDRQHIRVARYVRLTPQKMHSEHL